MNQRDTFETLLELHFGILGAACLYAAAKLRIADYVADGTTSNDEIAAQVGIQPMTLYRIMRLLCSRGVFKEESRGEFALTPLSERLRTDVEGSFTPYVEALTDYYFDALPGFLTALKEKKIPLEHHYGKPVFDWITETPERTEKWQQAFKGEHWPETDAVMAAYDFSRTKIFADIGGGHGEVVINFLRKYEQTKAVVFDSPMVIEQTKNTFTQIGLSDRCDFVSGDFFESIPVKADTYFLRHILHDWNDTECLKILRNIVDSAEPGSRILITECVLKDTNEPDIGKLCDIEMLMAVSGMERSEGEYQSLMEQAGIKFTRLITTDSIVSIVEGETKS
jgi:hypothetical protein